MPDATLLTDDELKAIAERNQPSDDVPPSTRWDVDSLLSHIAAQAALQKKRVEIRVDGEELPIVVSRLDQLPTYAGVAIREYALRLKELAAEIARLRAVPDAVKRYAPDYANNEMYDDDTGRFVEYDELVAAIGGANG